MECGGNGDWSFFRARFERWKTLVPAFLAHDCSFGVTHCFLLRVKGRPEALLDIREVFVVERWLAEAGSASAVVYVK